MIQPRGSSSPERWLELLSFLYGADRASAALRSLQARIERHRRIAPAPPASAGPLSHRDAILITYGDQLIKPGETPLRILNRFLQTYLRELLPGVHVLPFFPYSSDDGFSVIDYRQVDPRLGSWEDVRAIAAGHRLMVDAVVNHISARSAWFQDFLQGHPQYQDYFITLDPETDLSQVVRPRDLPLLTPFETPHGTQYVWTTFSPDQIDLNFANPEVLLEILDLLLFYIRQGAQIIRLDAIAFLWKQLGTTCIHLPQTHAVVKLIRSVVDAIAPWVYIITETNVPHAENIAYFGNGTDEAHMVYQFALPPLVLHTFLTGDARVLSHWAAGLQTPSNKATFFNFLASHDGIGLRPAQGLLSERDLDRLIRWTEARAGGVSYRRIGVDTRQPYELNITYFEALAPSAEARRVTRAWISRFLASQAIMLALVGVPGIYFHSLIGSRNDLRGVRRTDRWRSINREKLDFDRLETKLHRPGTTAARVFLGYRTLLRARQSHPAFDPFGSQQVLMLNPGIFALLRLSQSGQPALLCLHEVAGQNHILDLRIPGTPARQGRDLIGMRKVYLERLSLEPYQVRWIALDEAS